MRRKSENSDCLSSVKINVFRTGLNALYVCLHYASFKKVTIIRKIHSKNEWTSSWSVEGLGVFIYLCVRASDSE